MLWSLTFMVFAQGALLLDLQNERLVDIFVEKDTLLDDDDDSGRASPDDDPAVGMACVCNILTFTFRCTITRVAQYTGYTKFTTV